MNIDEITKIFDKHVRTYNMNENAIKLKYRHSYRVMYICREIAKDLNLNEEDTRLAMVIGLLHDYARFEQWKQFKTFNDKNSIDHGDLAAKLLFEDGDINKFNISMKYYQTMYEAIKYHNKYNYPEKTSERNNLFCKLIKDADKLDIFYLISIGKIPIAIDDSEIMENINKVFYEERLLNKEDIRTNNDRIVFYLGMMYDLNFKYSYKYIKENSILEKIFELINKSEKMKEYFNHMDNYIEEGSKQYVRKKV